MIIDDIYKDVIKTLFEQGEWRYTRNGECLSAFDYNFKIDLQKEFPLLTLKKVFLKTMIGELIFFTTSCGKNRLDLEYLRECTFGKGNTVDENGEPKWTIWTDDQKRWVKTFGDLIVNTHHAELNPNEYLPLDKSNELGFLPYCLALSCCNLNDIILRIKTQPKDRRLIIDYMPSRTILKETRMYPLPPCHYSVQFYVSGNKLSCKYVMRSNDIGLGFPVNVAFYALLTYIVAKCCDLEVGVLCGSLGDYHLYENQVDMLKKCLDREPIDNGIKLDVKDIPINNIYDLVRKTSLDFLPLFKDYKSHDPIKCKLLV